VPFGYTGHMSISVGAKVVKHPSILALLDNYAGERNAEALMRRLARERVAFAKSHGWSGPPFCPRILASFSGIRCKEVSHDIGCDGRILEYPNKQVWIEYRAGRMPERQRFTMFHELAHTLFPDFCAFERRHQDGKKKSDPEKAFEHLCDVGASEMLFPHEEFTADLAGLTWMGIECIHHLRERYKASIDATVHRLVQLVPDLACAALFLTDQKGTSTGRGPLWVKYCVRHPSFKGYFQAGIPVPSYSVAVDCYHRQLPTTRAVKEVWYPYGKPRTWLVQAARLPAFPENPDYAKVVVLLFPSSYNGPG
jgi:hypothetical protein